MIYEVSGDILHSTAEAIAHGVAVNDDFKSDLARALREEWPSLYKDFRHYCQSTSPKAGTLWVWQGTGGRKIINLLTQEPPASSGQHPGPAHLEYVNHAVRDLREYLVEEGIKSVALPRLATGVGRLEWGVVYPLIQKHLGDLKIPVYLYTTYKKGETAVENN